MKSTTIFLIALLVFGSSAQFMRKQKDDALTSLAEIDNHHFGSSILSTLAIHMATEGPLEEIDSILKELQSQLKSDQEGADTAENNDKNWCSDKTAEYQRNIDNSQVALGNAKDRKRSHEEKLNIAENDLRTAKNDLSSVLEKIESGDKLRREQNAEYLQQISELDYALKALDDATVLVNHLRSGTSFVQLKSRFAKVHDDMSKSKVKHSLYQPIIQALSELASKADQETVKKILGLLGRLKESLATSRQQEVDEEASQKQNWDDNRARLVNEENSLRKRISELEAEILAHKSAIEDASRDINGLEVNIENNKAFLEKTTNDCNARRKSYAQVTDERNRERELLAKIQDHFANKLGNMKNYLRDRVNA